jgi:hypothetical protein
MISIVQRAQLRFIVIGIPLQPGNSLFHRAAESGTYLKAFMGNAVGDHGGHLDAEFSEARKIISGQASCIFCLCRY